MLPGFHAILGSEVHASITLDSSFCEPETKSLLLVGNPNHEVASLTRANEFRVDQKNKGLKISPNPNTGRFELELSGFEGPARVVVTNASGRVVARLEMKNQNRHTFDFSAMDKGLYLVTVLSGNERRSGKVLVR